MSYALRIKELLCDERGKEGSFEKVKGDRENRCYISEGRVVRLAGIWVYKSLDGSSGFGCWMKEHPKNVPRHNFELT